MTMKPPRGGGVHRTMLAAFLLAACASGEEGARRDAGSAFRDCPECPEMVVVPAGSFRMELPPLRRVTISEPFAVGKYEVTRGEFASFVSATGYDTGSGCRTRNGYWRRRSDWRSPDFSQTDQDPAVCMSWHHAQAYVAWLSEKTGKGYRLLSESEWEYAARAGTVTRYSWGDEIGRNRANCDGCGSRWDDRQTAPVGSFAANDFGLHDMHGNVWEWVADCWRGDGFTGPPSSGSVWEVGDCNRRILRGGSWDNRPWLLGSANRYWYLTGNRSSGLGFRVARTLTREGRPRRTGGPATEEARNDDKSAARGGPPGDARHVSPGRVRGGGEGARRDAGSVFRDCAGCPEMVVAPAGSFRMGSPPSEEGRYEVEGPTRHVTISEPFAVGKYEVTLGEFASFVSATGYDMEGRCGLWLGGEWEFSPWADWRSPSFPQTDRGPVVCVNWRDAQAYVIWLSEKTGKGYRLLSESEWEYAARGGTRTARHWGEGASGQCDYANGADLMTESHYTEWVAVKCDDEDPGCGARRPGDPTWPFADCDDGHIWTAPVGTFKANGFGLHDMLGNVEEWVADCWNYDYSYAGAPSDGSVCRAIALESPPSLLLPGRGEESGAPFGNALDGRTGRRAAPSSLLPLGLLSSPLEGGRSQGWQGGGEKTAAARVPARR